MVKLAKLTNEAHKYFKQGYYCHYFHQYNDYMTSFQTYIYMFNGQNMMHDSHTTGPNTQTGHNNNSTKCYNNENENCKLQLRVL